MTEIILIPLLIWAAFELAFYITHKRPLNDDEISRLMRKRQKKYIKTHYTFKETNSYPSSDFKSGMDPNGGWYAADIELGAFPSYVAHLLKGKKHEWMVMACVHDHTVKNIYTKKGPSRAGVSLYIDYDDLIRLCKENDFQTLIFLHNHPNSDPQHYDCLVASDQDKRSAKETAAVLTSAGISCLEFVCERGSFLEYARFFAKDFFPEECSYDYIERQNKNEDNYYKLHRELGLFGGIGSSNIQNQNGIRHVSSRAGSGTVPRASGNASSGIGKIILYGLIAVIIIWLIAPNDSTKSKEEKGMVTANPEETTAVSEKVIEETEVVEAKEEEPALLLIITANLANIRKGPSSKTEVVTTAPRDTVFEGTGNSERAANGGLWYEIYIDDEKNITAWASEQVIKIKE